MVLEFKRHPQPRRPVTSGRAWIELLLSYRAIRFASMKPGRSSVPRQCNRRKSQIWSSAALTPALTSRQRRVWPHTTSSRQYASHQAGRVHFRYWAVCFTDIKIKTEVCHTTKTRQCASLTSRWSEVWPTGTGTGQYAAHQGRGLAHRYTRRYASRHQSRGLAHHKQRAICFTLSR